MSTSLGEQSDEEGKLYMPILCCLAVSAATVLGFTACRSVSGPTALLCAGVAGMAGCLEKFPLVADHFSWNRKMLPASVEELQQEEGAVSWLVISPLGAVVAYRERNWSAAASLTMLEYVCWSLFRGRKDLDPRLWRQIKDMEVARRIRTIKIGIDGVKENNMFAAPSVYWTSFWPRRRMGHRII